MNFEDFEKLSSATLQAAGLPPALLRPLFDKVSNDIFDIGQKFSLAFTEEEPEEQPAPGVCDGREMVLVANEAVSVSDPNCVWLIDHSWTFRLRECKRQLAANRELLFRVAKMIGMPNGFDSNAPSAPAEVYDSLWKYAGCYKLATTEAVDEECCWYLMDEVGSALAHSEVPNMCAALLPGFAFGKQCVYTVVWPVSDIGEGDICSINRCGNTVDVVKPTPAIVELKSRVMYFDEADEDRAEAIANCKKVYETLQAVLRERTAAVAERPANWYQQGSNPLPPLAEACPVTFYTDSKLVAENVTDPRFKMVEEPNEAKLLWLAHYALHSSDEFPSALAVSQLPEERIFTNKQKLASMVRDRCGSPPWFCTTYDTSEEGLMEFVGDYCSRQARCSHKSPPDLGRDDDEYNLWIVKPHNMARSIDMVVSDSLPWLLKLTETGPKIYAKYIANSATLRGRKFDLRFIVALRTLRDEAAGTPLELFLYKVFWTRFAAAQYALCDFDIYEKHWTVMNYSKPEQLLQMDYEAFIEEFGKENGKRDKKEGETWWQRTVMAKISRMLVEVFSAVPVDDVPHDRFRGLYGVDVMLRKTTAGIEPVLLELTYSPDCTRACKYHPSFFNDVFSTLFLGIPQNMTKL